MCYTACSPPPSDNAASQLAVFIFLPGHAAIGAVLEKLRGDSALRSCLFAALH